MADTIRLVHTNAHHLSTLDMPSPEALRLHGLAENALATALHLLRKPEASAAQLQNATARAVRAATLLKRASKATAGEGASCK